jgi:hypothetical protein
MDHVVEKMMKEGVALTQENYLLWAFLGEKSSLEELGGEEIAELPEGFEDWPVTEDDIH